MAAESVWSGRTAGPGRPHIAVVGGGISGLAAAWFLRDALGDDAEITVFEQRDEVGGHLRVSEVAGLPVDEGAESLLARRPEAVELARAVGLGEDIVHPAPVSAGVWSRDAIHPMPTGTVMGVPSDPSSLAGLLAEDEVRAAADRDRSGADGSTPMPLHDDVSIGHLVAGRLGRAVVDRLVEPLLGGVYAGHADELSLDATVPALGSAAREHPTLTAAVRSLQQAPTGPSAPAFAGLAGGIGRLPAAVAQASGAKIRTGVVVRELERSGGIWRLVTGPVPAPEVIEADAVILAVPSSSAARLLGDVCDAAAMELAAIETASMAVVTLAMPAESFPEPASSSGFLVPPIDGRTIKAVTYSSVKWPWLGESAGDLVLLRASIGRHRDAEQLQRSDDELVDAVLGDLGTAVGMTGRPIDARVTRWGGGLPQFAVGHLGRMARVRDAVSRLPGLAVCGAIYDGVGIAACVAAARQAAVRITTAQAPADPAGGHARIEP
ncbi:protoporphyrinogen oxidase [Phytoactinopolyspora endophytica]|uniref:protoporphyrinogen oxidase n=1 Tax=Phytoactinopolyspora endophytica TaxID=1642495 RepID=UPI00101CEC4A